MPYKEQPAGAHGILELIATLSAKGASGRLDVAAGTTEGALLFKNGKLVDARMGHLSGFQAINAFASMRDVRFHFDPSAAVPPSSSITPNERLVLKQFFGIETVGPLEDERAPVIVDEVHEPPVATSDVIHVPTQPPPIYQTRSRVPYIAAFALGVLVIAIAAAAVVLRSEFRERTSPTAVATAVESVPVESAPVATASTRRVEAETKANEKTTPAAPEVTAPAPELTTRKPESNGPEPRATTPVPQTTAPAAQATAPAVQATAPATDATTRNAETTGAAPNLNGKWTLVNTINSTSYRSFQNLQIGFAVSINQTGKTFTATGLKISENGRSLPEGSRTPIELKGFINGDRIEATFFEKGATRKSNGRFVWKIDPAGGALTGVFASSAARTSGKSTATREL